MAYSEQKVRPSQVGHTKQYAILLCKGWNSKFVSSEEMPGIYSIANGPTKNGSGTTGSLIFNNKMLDPSGQVDDLPVSSSPYKKKKKNPNFAGHIWIIIGFKWVQINFWFW